MSDSSEYKKVIEAALFVSGRAMSTEDIAKAAGIATLGHVNSMLEELMRDYERRDSALTIVKTGDRYMMSLKTQYAEKVNGLAGAPELTKGALRILAYISKNEPIMQSNVVKSFGSSSYAYLKELGEKDFIKASRTGRTKKLEITDKFKEYFNV